MLRLEYRRPLHVYQILSQAVGQKCTPLLLMLASWLGLVSVEAVEAQTKTEDTTQTITALIHKYERAASDADAILAGEVWLESNDVTFIHPR